MKRFLILFSLCFLVVPAAHGNDTASVEAEALEISDRLRCLVCSDENIENATDETAKDLRFFIRRHLTDGKSQDLVVNLILSQYGDMVTLEDIQNPSAQNEERFVIVSTILCFGAMAFYIFRRSRQYTEDRG